MRNKRGIELTINFIVILVLSLVVFGFGLKMLYDIMGQSQQLTDLSFEDLDRQLGEFACQPGEKVCIYPREKTLRQKEYGVLGVNVINNGNNPMSFKVVVYPDNTVSENNYDLGSNNYVKKLGFTENAGIQVPLLLDHNGCNQDCQSTNTKLHLLYLNNQYTLQPRESKKIAIGIEVPGGAVPGTYVFDVFVAYDPNAQPVDCTDLGYNSGDFQNYCSGSLVGPTTRHYDKLYGGEVYKLYVKVL